MFELAPLSLSLLFPFGTEGEKMFDSPAFKDAAREFAFTLDFIVASIGTDTDMIFAQLMEIVDQHPNAKRVRPEHWKLMGQALMHGLEKTLGDNFDDETQSCWASAFDTISAGMIKALKK